MIWIERFGFLGVENFVENLGMDRVLLVGMGVEKFMEGCGRTE